MIVDRTSPALRALGLRPRERLRRSKSEFVRGLRLRNARPSASLPHASGGHARRGFVYLLALLVVLVASAVTVVVARGVGLRLRAEQDAIARAQCRTAALGVLHAVVNDLTVSMAAGGLPKLVAVNPAGEPVGDCTVLLLGRDQAGTAVRFGLICEAGKLDANQARIQVLQLLPGMTTDIAAAISDWRDLDDIPDAQGGAERTDGAYAGALVPYAPRNAPFETIEELRLVRGVTDALYFGEDVNENGKLDPGEDSDNDGLLTPGLRDMLTLESREPANAPDGTPKVNVSQVNNQLRTRLTTLFGDERGNVLYALAQQQRPFANRLDFIAALELSEDETAELWPTLTGPEGRVGLVDAWSCRDQVLAALVGADLAKTIIAARPAVMPDDPAWLVAALKREGAKDVGAVLTSGSYQFRADLLAVRNDGAGWARLNATIDCAAGVVRVVSIQPEENQGWPLPWATPAQLRAGTVSNPSTFLTTGQP